MIVRAPYSSNVLGLSKNDRNPLHALFVLKVLWYLKELRVNHTLIIVTSSHDLWGVVCDGLAVSQCSSCLSKYMNGNVQRLKVK